jgi:hypothetical protein
MRTKTYGSSTKREEKQNPPEVISVCVVRKNKKEKCRTSKTETSTNRIQENSFISNLSYDRPWDPFGLLYHEYRVSLPGVKRPERGVNHPPPSSAEVKERVELYLYSPSGPSWSVSW